jgi:hypothetical protein
METSIVQHWSTEQRENYFSRLIHLWTNSSDNALLCVIFASDRLIVPLVVVTSLIFLALLGALAAYAGGAKILPGAARITFSGALAMAITAGVGAIFGSTP